jgi:hypothetical protein
MTPKEKALDLIHSFYYALPNNGSQEGINSTTRRYKEGVQCALIAVDEIIEQWEYIDVYLADGHGELNPNLKYWYEVKLEIQNRDDSKTAN